MRDRQRARIKGAILILWAIQAYSLGRGEVIELDPHEVVSTGTRTERLATEVPIRTEVLGLDLFERAMAPDLAAALEYLPGARVESNCQNCGTAEVKLLGLGAGYNQLLFAGQPLFSGLAAVYGLEHIPTAFIERVEVVKGGASSLYGPGAVAGVINIIPHEPLANGRKVDISYENHKGSGSRSVVGIWDMVDEANKLALTLYGEDRETEAVDLNEDGFSEITRKAFQTIGSNFWIYPGKKTRISGNYAYTGEERRGGDRFDLLPHESQITEELKHRWHRGGLLLEQDVGPDLKLRAGISVSHIDRSSYYGGVGNVPLPGDTGYVAAIYEQAIEEAALMYGFTKTTRLYLDSLLSYHTGNHILSVGIQGQKDNVFDEKRNDRGNPLKSDGTLAQEVGDDPIVDDDFSNTGFYLQDEWDPTNRMTLVTGIRVDKHSKLENWIASPRMAIRVTPGTDWILRTSVATGYRAPEIFDEDFHIEIIDDPTRTRNASDLSHERSLSCTAGFVWTPSFASGRLQTDVEFYRTELKDTYNVPDIVFIDEAGNSYKERRNESGSKVQGMEINLLYRFDKNFSVEGGITYTDASFDNPVEILPGILEHRYLESPQWSGVAKINYSKPGWADFFLGVIYTGPMVAVREGTQSVNEDTGNFVVIDISATRHIEMGGEESGLHLDLSIGVRNLLDQRQGDLTSGADRDTTYFYGPRFPRSYFISARMKF